MSTDTQTPISDSLEIVIHGYPFTRAVPAAEFRKLEREFHAANQRVAKLERALEVAESALSAASRDIHESLQVAIYNLHGKARDGFKYGKPPRKPVLVHERGIKRSEEVEAMCDKAICVIQTLPATPSPSATEGSKP